MNLQHRIRLLSDLGEYILSNDAVWQETKERASQENGWFTLEFVELALRSIGHAFLQAETLERWTAQYQLPEINPRPKNVGIVMAGNIPLVGFHDLLCVFITGNKASVKLSSKDEVLLKHLVQKLEEWDSEIASLILFAPMLKGCDAYIATGSNNTAGHFAYYFGKYPHIIRRNRTSVAVLTGKESAAELSGLSDDVYQYFGRGCRNVTKLYVHRDYDFIPLITAFKRYNYLGDHHKYKNNYDYNLAIHLLNGKYYMSNESILLVEEAGIFSPVSQLNYEFYDDEEQLVDRLKNDPDVQCRVGNGATAFGETQKPGISDYADGVDTMAFLSRLSNNP